MNRHFLGNHDQPLLRCRKLETKKKPQTPVKRLANTIQSTSALQTCSCNTPLSYWCQSKRGMNPSLAMCLSMSTETWVRLSSINIAGMSPNPERLSHKLYQITHRLREGLETPEPCCILAQQRDSHWVCQKKPCRSHSGQMLLAVSNRYLSGSAWLSIMGPLLINQTGLSPPCWSPRMRSGSLFSPELGWPAFCSRICLIIERRLAR